MRAAARSIITGGAFIAVAGIILDVVAISTIGFVAVGIGVILLITMR